MGTKNIRAGYPNAVIDALASEFSDLTDPATAAVVRGATAGHMAAVEERFECIIDDPIVANWRLRLHRDQRSRVRVACYRPTPTKAEAEREQRVNRPLNVLPAPA